jgi:hypothetical protein
MDLALFALILFTISSVIADEEKQIKSGKGTAEEGWVGWGAGAMMAERYIYVPANEEATEFSFCVSHRSHGRLILASGRTNPPENIDRQHWKFVLQFKRTNTAE